MKLFLSLLAPLIFFSNVEAATFPNSLKDKDFFVIQSDSFAKEEKIQSDSCREHIKKVICLVDPMKDDGDYQKRPCLEGGQSYAIHFEELHDNYPPALQKMFCSLTRIFVEKVFHGTAYASSITDSNNNLIGALIGIRKSVLDESLNLKTWTSWKEQLSFGGVTGSYTVSPDLPSVATSTSNSVNDFLYFVMTHEFGHIFDFANKLNEFEGTSKGSIGPWSSISWETETKPKASSDFKNRSGLCFYACNGNTLKKNTIIELYEDLFNSDFISTYAATNPWDDFAESLAYFAIDQELRSNYVLDTKQGKAYDSISKLKSPVFSAKLKFVRDFLERTDIIYP